MNKRLRIQFQMENGESAITGWTYDHTFEEMHHELTKLYPRSITLFDSAPDVNARMLRLVPLDPGKFKYIHLKDEPANTAEIVGAHTE